MYTGARWRDNDDLDIDITNLSMMAAFIRIEERENVIQETSDFRYDKCFVEALLEFRVELK